MTDLSFKERAARLGLTRAIDRVTSGSREAFILQVERGDRFPKRVSAAMALARRGLSLSEAKQAIADLLESCQALVTLPVVEDVAAVVEDMERTGVFALHLKFSTANLLQVTLGLPREEIERRFGTAAAMAGGAPSGTEPATTLSPSRRAAQA